MIDNLSNNSASCELSGIGYTEGKKNGIIQTRIINMIPCRKCIYGCPEYTKLVYLAVIIFGCHMWNNKNKECLK